MDVVKSSEKIRMRKELVFIIQEFISSDHGWDFGQRAGHAVDLLGKPQGAEEVDIKELLKMLHLSSALIMVKLIQRVQLTPEFHLIQIGFVERITLIILSYLIGNEKKEILRRANAMGIQVTFREPKMIQLVSGHVAIMMLLMDVVHAQKWSTSHLNGQMKKQRNTSMINLEDQTLIDL